MTDVKKIITTAFSTFAATVVGGLIILSFTNFGESNKKRDEKLDKKLDKTEYQKDCNSIKAELMLKVDNDVFQSYLKTQHDNQESLKDIQADIKTILREMPR